MKRPVLTNEIIKPSSNVEINTIRIISKNEMIIQNSSFLNLFSIFIFCSIMYALYLMHLEYKLVENMAEPIYE